jgi:hypothetical protein
MGGPNDASSKAARRPELGAALVQSYSWAGAPANAGAADLNSVATALVSGPAPESDGLGSVESCFHAERASSRFFELGGIHQDRP